MSKQFIVITAGHVDHGKSALVQALTGTNPDRLSEEKARGITIELGFAHLQLTADESAPITLDLSVIDVPGHEDFVSNMVMGAGAVDLALLVVAADDGWMPQTEEHLQILAYLGCPRAIVVLTKIDLCGSEPTAVIEGIRQKLNNSPFAAAPIVQTSVVTGEGLQELREILLASLRAVSPKLDIGKPRLPIDRVFTLPGIGTVVTGTLNGGSLCKGQEVIIEPSEVTARIRLLQNHNRECSSLGPGTRAALNLVDLRSGNRAFAENGQAALRRGLVVTLPGLGQAHPISEVMVERTAREQFAAPRPLRSGTRIRCHLGSTHVPARLWLAQACLNPGERCVGQLRCEAPVFAFCGDRFVIRDWSEQTTLAGGVVLEPCASRKSFRAQSNQPLQNGTWQINPLNAAEAQLQRKPVLLRRTLLRQSNFSTGEIEAALAQLSAQGKVLLKGDYVIETQQWNRLLEQTRAGVDRFHQEHPSQLGMPLAELRSVSGDCQLVFDPVIAQLTQDGFLQVGPLLKRRSHLPVLPLHLQAIGTRLRQTLASKPAEPPSRKELAPDQPSQEVLRFLMQTGEIIELSPELVVPADTFARFRDSVRRLLRRQGSATVSELRQSLGTTRRVLVPLLETLDRQGVTRRQGDKRILAS